MQFFGYLNSTRTELHIHPHRVRHDVLVLTATDNPFLLLECDLSLQNYASVVKTSNDVPQSGFQAFLQDGLIANLLRDPPTMQSDVTAGDIAILTLRKDAGSLEFKTIRGTYPFTIASINFARASSEEVAQLMQQKYELLLKDTSSREQAYQQQLKDARSSEEQALSQLSALKSKLEALESDSMLVQKTKRQMDVIQERKKQLEEENAELQRQLDEARQQNQRLQEQLTKTSYDKQATELTLQGQISSLREQLRQLQSARPLAPTPVSIPTPASIAECQSQKRPEETYSQYQSFNQAEHQPAQSQYSHIAKSFLPAKSRMDVPLTSAHLSTHTAQRSDNTIDKSQQGTSVASLQARLRALDQKDFGKANMVLLSRYSNTFK